MCGIIGYIGKNNAVPILVDGLKRLEYRGYDSAGVAISYNGKIYLARAKCRVTELEKKISKNWSGDSLALPIPDGRRMANRARETLILTPTVPVKFLFATTGSLKIIRSSKKI